MTGKNLTTREREVLELAGAGLREDEIAARLRIARSTVATLLRSSMAKLGARTRVEAAAKLASPVATGKSIPIRSTRRSA